MEIRVIMRDLHDATQSTKYLLLQSLGDLAMRPTNTNALILSRMICSYFLLQGDIES